MIRLSTSYPQALHSFAKTEGNTEMASFLLLALFTASAALAIASIAFSMHRYGPAALHLKDRLARCPEQLTVRWKVTTIESGLPDAQILRPDFRAKAKAVQQQRGLRAAA